MSVAQQPGPAFCAACGTILNLGAANLISCECCGRTCRYSDLPQLHVESSSKPRAPPQWLEQQYAADESGEQTRATVDEPCPNCENPTLKYYTMQMRSADEGQTVFYECPKCNHKFSVNT